MTMIVTGYIGATIRIDIGYDTGTIRVIAPRRVIVIPAAVYDGGAVHSTTTSSIVVTIH